MLPSSISFIYDSLKCLHSVQPAAADEGYRPPTIPALKADGFVKWQTIQLLLGPEEHVPFLQNAVRQFDIIDPEDLTPFPKILPKECFPDRPDEEMTQWYEKSSQRLRLEARGVAQPQEAPERNGTRRTNSTAEEWSSADEKSDAAEYFADPMYKGKRTRPSVVRRLSRQVPRSPREYVADRGRAVAHRVRHFINPETRDRRKGLPDRYPDEVVDDDLTPTGVHPRYVPPRAARHRSPSLGDSDSDLDERPPRRPSRSPRRRSPNDDDAETSPVIPRRRSHDLSRSPHGYFPPQEQHYRRHSAHLEPNAGVAFVPSKAPPFAAQVAHLSARTSAYDGRRVKDREYERERESERERGRQSSSSSSSRYQRPGAELDGAPRYERPSYVRSSPGSTSRIGVSLMINSMGVDLITIASGSGSGTEIETGQRAPSSASVRYTGRWCWWQTISGA